MADKQYDVSALLFQSIARSYSASAVLLKLNTDVTYTASALLLGITQCKVPGAVILPRIDSLAIQAQGNNIPKVALLPTLLGLGIQIKSC